MKSFKSVRLQAYRGAEAVHVEDVFLFEPKTGEVLVSVHAAGVNPIDWKIRAGYLPRRARRLSGWSLRGAGRGRRPSRRHLDWRHQRRANCWESTGKGVDRLRAFWEGVTTGCSWSD